MAAASGAPLFLSGDTFTAVYAVYTASESEAHKIAKEIAVEQTVEFPVDLISRTDILEGIVGRVEGVHEAAPGVFHVAIVYAAETAGTDFIQFLNVLFGNTGLKPGIRLVDFSLSETLTDALSGPGLGIAGIRERVGAKNGPILATAIKPMGLDNRELARSAAAYAEGGIDIIKDDHGLADQPFCRFEERVDLVADTVNNANARRTGRCLYFPNISGPAEGLAERVEIAVRAGCGGVMLAPGLMGFDALRSAAALLDGRLPILSHPAFLGSAALCQNGGIAHGLLFGKLVRAAGADISVFPSFGGRFTFSREECGEIVKGLTDSSIPFAPALPGPAGGMTVDRIRALSDFYGNDALFLIGGDLHRSGPDLAAACRDFRHQVARSFD